MHFTTKDSTTIYYELPGDEKSSETVAFLNGIISSTDSWEPLVKPLNNSGLKVLLHDFRGQLRSDKPAGPYTFEQHLDDFICLLDTSGIKKIHLVGASYGSIVGQEMAIRYPDRVSSLSLVNPLSELDMHFSWIVNEWKELSIKREKELFYNNLASIIYSDAYFDDNRNDILARKEKLIKLDDDYWNGLVWLFDNTLRNTNNTARLSGITCPVFIIAGDEDVLTPIKFSRVIKNNIPQSEMVIVPGCGHASMLEKPMLISSLIMGFVLRNSENNQ